MGRRKKLINNSGIPQHEIEHIARCILPDILAYYESEEGQREFLEWLVYNAPVEYVNLLLSGDIREYLKNVTEYHPFES